MNAEVSQDQRQEQDRPIIAQADGNDGGTEMPEGGSFKKH